MNSHILESVLGLLVLLLMILLSWSVIFPECYFNLWYVRHIRGSSFIISCFSGYNSYPVSFTHSLTIWCYSTPPSRRTSATSASGMYTNILFTCTHIHTQHYHKHIQVIYFKSVFAKNESKINYFGRSLSKSILSLYVYVYQVTWEIGNILLLLRVINMKLLWAKCCYLEKQSTHS